MVAIVAEAVEEVEAAVEAEALAKAVDKVFPPGKEMNLIKRLQPMSYLKSITSNDDNLY